MHNLCPRGAVAKLKEFNKKWQEAIDNPGKRTTFLGGQSLMDFWRKVKPANAKSILHGHHIVQKVRNPNSKLGKIVEESQAILRKHGIDPYRGPENLVWAPQHAVGIHGGEAQQKILDALRAADLDGRGAVIDVLEHFGKFAARRR